MSSKKVSISSFDKAINDILKEYAEDTNDVLQDTIPIIGKKVVSELKKKSPKRTGKYAKGWTLKQEKERLSISAIAYNKDRYQLTHLLEKGHANRGGGRTQGRPHIKPVEDKFVKETLNKIKKGISSI